MMKFGETFDSKRPIFTVKGAESPLESRLQADLRSRLKAGLQQPQSAIFGYCPSPLESLLEKNLSFA
jgi:hypothetical protein